jgi:hypothetical protein
MGVAAGLEITDILAHLILSAVVCPGVDEQQYYVRMIFTQRNLYWCSTVLTAGEREFYREWGFAG